jgi:hypothetical protein
MATMPAVAGEPWKWAEQEAKLGDDLYKMFYDQRHRAELAQQDRDLRMNLQNNQLSANQALQTERLGAATALQNDRFDFTRERDESLMEGGNAASGKLVDRMKEKMNDLVGMGVPQHIAAAMVGNAVQESKLNSSIIGDGGASFGEYQFNDKGEGPAMRKFAAERGGSHLDPKMQRQFVWSQLQGPYRHVLDKMLAAKDPAVAAEIFSREYERPSAQFANNKARARYATQAYTLYGVRPDGSQQGTSTQAPGQVAATTQQPGQQQPQTAAVVPPTNSGTGTMPSPAGGKRTERVIDPATGKLVYREIK